MDILRKVWQTWKRIGQAVGDIIGRIVLTIFYFTIFAPFGIGVRLWGDPLAIKTGDQAQWVERSTRDWNLEDGRRLS